MKILLIIILIWILTACSVPKSKEANNISESKETVLPADWKLITTCGIEFYIPSNLKEEEIQPIDSCAKEYISENLRLMIDVLEFSPAFEFTRSKEYSKENDFKVEKTVIDGLPAEIITYTILDREGKYYGAVLDVPRMKLTMWAYGKNPEERENATKIFKSVGYRKE